MKKTNKKKNRPLSLRARKALKLMVANGITQAEAMRQAGYSESIAKVPSKVTGTKAFIEALERVGLTDSYLAKGYKEFTKAGELREYTFLHKIVKEIVDLDEDHPKYKKGGINKEEITRSIPISDKKIRETIERITGAELIDIQDHHDRRVAFYQKPDFAARKTGFELSSKVKGHLQPDNGGGTVEHVMSEEDRNIFNKIFNNNKK